MISIVRSAYIRPRLNAPEIAPEAEGRRTDGGILLIAHSSKLDPTEAVHHSIVSASRHECASKNRLSENRADKHRSDENKYTFS